MRQVRGLTFVSLLAPNADAVYRALFGHLGTITGIPIKVIDELGWQERATLLRGGLVDLGALCGATYAEWRDQRRATLGLLAAPQMAAPRYAGRPVYFSDIVVRAESTVGSFADLTGATLAYNEPQSFSGWHVLRAYLQAQGPAAPAFGRQLASGSHEASLELLLAGAVDAAILDSIVLERALQLNPALSARLRSVLTLGPSPVPPLVTGRPIQPAVYQRLRAGLIHMHGTPAGRAALEAAQIARFVPIEDSAYDPLREILRRGEAGAPRQPSQQRRSGDSSRRRRGGWL